MSWLYTVECGSYNPLCLTHRQVASITDNNNLTGRQGQLIAAMTQDTKTDYTKEAKLLLGAVEVLLLLLLLLLLLKNVNI